MIQQSDTQVCVFSGSPTCSETAGVNQAKMVSSRLFLVRMVPGLC